MATKKIGIIGKGNVGAALNRGLGRAGHDTQMAGREAGAAKRVATWGDIVIIAVPFGEVESVLREVGNAVDGKTLVDVTNALTPKMELALGFTTSGAEELQKRAPRARVVKAFNTVFAQHMDTGKIGHDAMTVFAAGDDDAARKEVVKLAQEIGFDAVEAGPLANARHLEAMGMFNISLGYIHTRLGPGIGLKLVRG